MKKRIFTSDERDLILGAYLSGTPASKIVPLVSCDPPLLYGFLRDQGFDVKDRRYKSTSKSVRDFLLKKNATLRSEGVYVPRGRSFSQADKDLALQAFLHDKMSVVDVGLALGCSGGVATRLLRNLGVNTNQCRGDRIRRGILKGYQQGRQVPSSCGYGTKVLVSTPFQGNVMMRSRLEASRATYLDDKGVPWFYEVQRFTLLDGRTYLPDFWVADCTMERAQSILGACPAGAPEILDFLSGTPHRVEDVKGWWRADHPSYPKVSAFQSQYQGEFNVIVRKKDEWLWQ